jgi:hypothetical protein
LLFGSKNFGPARAEFTRAHDLSHEPRLLYNLAVCDKELGRYGRALAELRQSLVEGGTKLPASYVTAVRDTIGLLEPLVTPLEIDSDPAGATVLVDGESVGATPLPAGVLVDIGDHEIVVRRTSFVENVRRVTAVGGHPVELHITLEPLVQRGRLVVQASDPTGEAGTVTVDGVEVGRAPWSGQVAAGVHIVAARSQGYSVAPRPAEVGSGGTTDLALALVPDSRLRLTVDDADATVELDAKPIGRGSFDGAVPSGEHRLRVARADHHGAVYESEIALGRGETRTMSIQIHRSGEIPTWMYVAGAGVLVAGAVTVAVILLTKHTDYEGSSAGTLSPGLQPTSVRPHVEGASLVRF